MHHSVGTCSFCIGWRIYFAWLVHVPRELPCKMTAVASSPCSYFISRLFWVHARQLITNSIIKEGLWSLCASNCKLFTVTSCCIVEIKLRVAEDSEGKEFRCECRFPYLQCPKGGSIPLVLCKGSTDFCYFTATWMWLCIVLHVSNRTT